MKPSAIALGIVILTLCAVVWKETRSPDVVAARVATPPSSVSAPDENVASAPQDAVVAQTIDTSPPAPPFPSSPSPEPVQAVDAAPAMDAPDPAKVAWTEAWNRPLPEPDTIDIDMRSGTPVRTVYEKPAPLAAGTTLVNADGSVSMVYDGLIVNADGSKAQVKGDVITNADGSIGVLVGNEILWSDGSKSSR